MALCPMRLPVREIAALAEAGTIARYFTEICCTRNWSISGADLAQYAKKDILDNLAGWSNKFLDKAMEIIVGRKDQ